MITITNLSNKKNGNNYSYSDLHLDLVEKQTTHNKQNNKVASGNDILIDVDEQAIRNSVVNLLFQKRYLSPTVNMSLHEFIGQPLTEGTSNAIGGKIYSSLLLLEPRIKVEKIIVGPNDLSQSYNIAVIYTLNNFPKNTQVITGLLNNSNGIFTLNNLNN